MTATRRHLIARLLCHVSFSTFKAGDTHRDK